MTERVPAVDELLAGPTVIERLAFLRTAALDDEPGLRRLLDTAAELAHHDPRRGLGLAELCAAAARVVSSPGLLPRAEYVQAQAMAIDGRLTEALHLIESARRGWAAQGSDLEALRTGLGRMHVLLELGEHRAAVDTGADLLAGLAALAATRQDGTGEPVEHVTLRASTYQNLGGAYGFMGRYQDALAAYRTARAEFDGLGIPELVAPLHENCGVELVNLGRIREAETEFGRAIALYREHGHALGHACSLIELGRARLLAGELRGALDTFDEAAALLQPLGVRPDRDRLAVSRGDAYLALNLLDEALATYDAAERAFRAGGMVHNLASVLSSSGAALARAGRVGDAERVLAEAGRLWESAGNVPMRATTLLELAALRERRGDRAAAVALTASCLDSLAGGEWTIEECYAHLRMADLSRPDHAAVERHLGRAAELAATLGLPHLSYRVDERLGALRRAQGRLSQAQELLERAVATVESLRGALPREAVRASFLADKTAAYTELVGLWLDRGDPASLRRAFDVAERVKSRSLVELMVGTVGTGTGTGTAGRPGDPVTERLRTLRADLSAVYNELLDGAGDGGGTDGVRGRRAVLHDRAVLLERDITLLRLRTPAGRAPRDPLLRAALPRAVLDGLPPGQTVLAYHILDGEVVAFLAGPGRLEVVRRVSTVDRLRPLLTRLTSQWARVRMGGLADRHGPLLWRGAVRVLAQLHRELIEPVRGLLPAGPAPGRLAVVPHGLLHQVPFHALFDGERPMLRRWEICYAPSVTTLGLLGPYAGADGPAVILGVADPDIPEVAAEVADVSRLLPGASVWLDELATSVALESAAPGCRVVHIACHGIFRRGNPMFSALRLHDGWLTAADAARLDLRGALVVLSACESGAHRVLGGDEVVGLPRAFLGAGAAAVLVSLWLAQDDTTAVLMRVLYTGLRAGLRPAAALRAAQLAVAERYPHPYHWAPFIAICNPSDPPTEAPHP
jgi:tetratricopeptide (TPR) repeat protein